MRRVLRLTAWALREPAYLRMALLVYLVLLFTLTAGVVRSGGGHLQPPERTVENVLNHTVAWMVPDAFPFLFPLVAVLATLALVVQRERGTLAAYQALGGRRWELYVAQTAAVLSLTLGPALLALLALPPLVEPSLAASGNLLGLYPFGYWASAPRLLLAILFLVLVASALGLLLRSAAVAFGAMIGVFFVGWYLGTILGAYALLAPAQAFGAAYDVYRPLEGIPWDPNWTFAIYLGAAGVLFSIALCMPARSLREPAWPSRRFAWSLTLRPSTGPSWTRRPKTSWRRRTTGPPSSPRSDIGGPRSPEAWATDRAQCRVDGGVRASSRAPSSVSRATFHSIPAL